ncbi:hypothetical protein A2818_01105 [Candidatus Nomurabacteria bacterium RIFCSPHIGHO2_01_FULL_40_12]|uniref:Cell division protein FtsL n=1 Tax=Candidatus Nomurabacteria bacterium RIFCSPHIGHO2_01_FULL_40_12 TaxID=1801737 RepID=A0A1F6UYR9_9BACT|nr:MAG: hypothetical protein A2818_01105 [Candidatus Nomurabacteria bacterium RIFCSPHIGHO2_01_FULL_40_12]
MKQMSLQFKMRMDRVSTPSIISNEIEKVLLKIILWSFVAVAFWYVLLLGNMVSNILQRRALEINARNLSNEVGELELAYLSTSSSIDLNLAYTLGFKETKAKFATRKSLGQIKILPNEI